ncbi:MAG: AbrB family transcriptional regulator [Erysipelotrichaceae bacterium]|nr:AbrB family transcriptional regulator [Erysipelotrichaceae bacterium]
MVSSLATIRSAVMSSAIPNFMLGMFVSVVGGLVAKKLRMVAPYFVGGILFVASFNIAWGGLSVLPYTRFVLQIISGTYIGSMIHKRDIGGFRKLLIPILSSILGMFLINLILGTVIHRITGLDLFSVLLGCIPGGLADTTIIAEQMGADVSISASLQLVRCVLALALFPAFAAFLTRKDPAFHETQDEGLALGWKYSRISQIVFTLVVGLIGGLIGYRITFIPAAPLVFSIIVSTFVNCLVCPLNMPRKTRRFAQVMAALYIGTFFDEGFIQIIFSLLAPIIILVLGVFVLFPVLSNFLAKVFHLNRKAMLFACIPAGASDMSLIASELKCESPSIAIFQIARLVSCIVLFPKAIKIYVDVISWIDHLV